MPKLAFPVYIHLIGTQKKFHLSWQIPTWYHFPDNDSKYKNIDSKILLKKTIDLLAKEDYSVSNIDSTICLQKPKIIKYIIQMKSILAEVIGIDKECISIKATTTERLGSIGQGKGIAAEAVVSIKPIDQ